MTTAKKIALICIGSGTVVLSGIGCFYPEARPYIIDNQSTSRVYYDLSSLRGSQYA